MAAKLLVLANKKSVQTVFRKKPWSGPVSNFRSLVKIHSPGSINIQNMYMRAKFGYWSNSWPSKRTGFVFKAGSKPFSD